jgi:Flp pilus assembly protein TadB
MNGTWALVFALLGALVLIGAAAAWLAYRKRMAEIQRQLAWSENSRFALEEHAREVDARLQAMSEALDSQQRARHGTPDVAARRGVLAGALHRMTHPPVAPAVTPWADTEPMVAESEAPRVPPARSAEPTRH